jgi:hypothetical protein
VTVLGLVASALLVACGDSGSSAVGPPSVLQLNITTGLTAPANTVLPAFTITVLDAHGHRLPDQTVTLAVTAGSGLIGTNSLVSDANGNITVSDWKLGRSALPQKLTASIGAVTLDVNATVTTAYQIVVRFWGDQTALTDANKALFTNAAARIKGIVTGDIQDVSTNGPNGPFDLANCGVTGQPPLNETIDDVVIYASIQNIDGAGGPNGNILAQAGPCAGRPTVTGYHTAIGVMEFDSYDFPNLAGPGGSLQDVVTHEMLHVLGFGVYWPPASPDTNPGGRDLLSGVGSGDPRYTGTNGRQGCVAFGATTTCASSVPAENVGGAGSENSHWRESVFQNELMTSRLNAGYNPISSMTVGSLADLGFVVNTADNDNYTFPGPSLVAIKSSSSLLGAANPQWERVLQPRFIFERNGTVRELKVPLK